MLKNYLKIAFRNFTQNKSFALLSILSLSIAITSVVLIGMYAYQEFSYDTFHERSEDIYRLVTVSENLDNRREVAFVPLALGPHLKENFSSVENFARVWVYRRSMPVSNPERDADFYEDRFAWADGSFFSIFDFEITAGNRENPLGEFRSVVISESMAEKYFGNENPIGKQLYFRGETDIPLYVSAVMKAFPANSHIRFDFVADIRVAAEDFWQGGRATQEILQEWINLFVPAYIKTKPGAEIQPILDEANRLMNEHLSEVSGASYSMKAQSIESIHLTSNVDIGEFEVNGSEQNVYAVLVIGMIVLALGCFNFVNLVTAQAGRRTKEVGLRKTMGGTRSQLMLQHYLESSIMVLMAVLLSLVSVEILIPFLRNFIIMGNMGDFLADFKSISVFIGFVLFVVGIAGAYPALFVSKFSPGSVLKGSFSNRLSGGALRKVLITMQFALSSALIVCTLVVYQQLEFMKTKELGFSEEQIVVIPIHRDNAIIPNLNRVKESFTQNSNISGVTASSHLMFATFTYTDTFELFGSEQEYRWERYTVEADYPSVYGLNLIAGRFFRYDTPADTNAVILNEQAVRELGLEPEEAVGQILENRTMDIEGPIVGVVEDFHYQSLHEDIQPFALINYPQQIDFISVKINSDQVSTTLDFMEEAWSEVIPEGSFGYFFLDETFGASYQREENLGNAVIGFSLTAIFLACLGLFGLSLFTAERRTKEIGIRKVLGASVWEIIRLLGTDFSRLVLLALGIALPVAYLVMTNWLNDFAYQIDISYWMILAAGFFVLLISWLTVSWHSFRAAMVNPVQSLKSE